MLPEPIGSDLIDQLTSDCDASFRTNQDGVLESGGDGKIYAARNLIRHVPIVRDFWQHGFVRTFLINQLGHQFGLVRVLYFDKPPDRTWSLPWHKDTAIAVKKNNMESNKLTRPTMKAGTPHVIAADDILHHMLTLRVHLDAVTLENGPLKVIPASHHSSSNEGDDVSAAETIQARAGEVLAMRPLLTHSSGSSQPGTKLHRRILHLEFSDQEDLPDSYQWHDFVALSH
ncbi:MAG: phytanoyl-CoA dioxygenase family protein [Rubripirellula sp.]